MDNKNTVDNVVVWAKTGYDHSIIKTTKRLQTQQNYTSYAGMSADTIQ